MSRDLVAERRRRILLAAIREHQPASIDDLPRIPALSLWTRDALHSTLDAAVIDGVLVEGLRGELVTLIEGRLL